MTTPATPTGPADVKAALSQLDGSPESAISLLTGVSADQLGEYGGMPAPKVIGIDLSLTCTGVAGNFINTPDGWTDVIKPPTKLRGHERLAWIQQRIADHTRTAALVAIEGPAYGSQRAGIQRGHHERAGLWWITTHRLWRADIPVAVIDPTAVKRYATGKGNADKAAVMLAVARRFPWFEGGEDEADALVLAAMAADHLGQPMADMPATHRKALDAVQWPEQARPVVAPYGTHGHDHTDDVHLPAEVA